MTAPHSIVLRPWRPTDAEDLRTIFGSAADLSAQFPRPVTTVEQAASLIAEVLTCSATGVQLAIIVPASGVVGNVAITQIERRHDTGWVSYFSSGEVRGQGLVSRATAAICTWALTELGLHRLELGYRLNNPASGKVAAAAGFHAEGIERDRLRYGEERFDVRRCARLATDPAPPADRRVRLTGLPSEVLPA